MNQRPVRHPWWTPLLLVLLALPVGLALLFLNVVTEAFRLLGLSPRGALLLLLISLVGSLINIPLTRRRIVLADPALERLPPVVRQMLPYFHYDPPLVTEEILAVNVGGAVVPVVFSVYLCTLRGTSIPAAVAATVVVTVVTKLFARPRPGVGVTLPAFVAPLTAAVAAHGLVRLLGADPDAAAPAAYIAGTLGTLIGADLLNLPRLLRGRAVGDAEREAGELGLAPAPPARTVIASIGGAGVFDGIFLSSVLAPLLARGV